MEQANKTPTRLTLTDQMRRRFKGILDPIGAFLNRLGLMPNTVTILGLVGNTIGAYFLATGHMASGACSSSLWDRSMPWTAPWPGCAGEASNFGAFVDSVTDRYSELVIFGGLLFYYLQHGDGIVRLAGLPGSRRIDPGFLYAGARPSRLVSIPRSVS